MSNIIQYLMENEPLLCAGTPAEETSINEAEMALHLTFAEDYRACQKAFGAFAYDGHEFTGITEVQRLNVQAVTEWARGTFPALPDDWYVIEKTGLDGIVAFQRVDGCIFMAQPGTEPVMAADSLMSYLVRGG